MPKPLSASGLTKIELEKLAKAKCPIPNNEDERMYALRQTELLDSDGDDPMFDRFASLAKRLFKVPIALVTLVDIDRQWFKANIGLEGVMETHRDISFCARKFSSILLSFWTNELLSTASITHFSVTTDEAR